MRRSMYGAALAVTLGLGAAMPVLAGTVQRVPFVTNESWTVDHACGVVEQTSLTAHGAAFFDENGAWLRDIIVFSVVAVFTGPGGSLTTTDHQVGEFTPETGTYRGQGMFIHGGKVGVVAYDVGRLVFDADDGSTLFATPKVIPFDDPDAMDAVDAALCDLLG